MGIGELTHQCGVVAIFGELTHQPVGLNEIFGESSHQYNMVTIYLVNELINMKWFVYIW